MTREQDTKLIQSEQRAAILDEQLKAANKQLEKLKRTQGDQSEQTVKDLQAKLQDVQSKLDH